MVLGHISHPLLLSTAAATTTFITLLICAEQIACNKLIVCRHVRTEVGIGILVSVWLYLVLERGLGIIQKFYVPSKWHVSRMSGTLVRSHQNISTLHINRGIHKNSVKMAVIIHTPLPDSVWHF